MRLALISLFLAASALYTAAAWHSFRAEMSARGTGTAAVSAHPEANLRIVRESLDSKDYSDRLIPHIETSLEQAPSFYQAPFLMASFYANRLEQPELTRRSFEAALTRFPSNGRLHLTYAEWLLLPRATAPYRSFRNESVLDARGLALDHIESATTLEPDLTQQALNLMLRFQVPIPEWVDRLPPSEETNALLLHVMDRTPGHFDVRRKLLAQFLESATTSELLRWVTQFGEKWGEPELSLRAAERWREKAIESGAGDELVQSTVALARMALASGNSESAYRLLRETLSTIEERDLPSENALEILCMVGDEYRRRGQHAMAQGLYSEAVAMSRYHAPAYVGLARNYRATGDLENARREIDELLRFDPSNEDGRRELEELMKLAMKGR
jgi:Tfp pilus assembly protein PilF